MPAYRDTARTTRFDCATVVEVLLDADSSVADARLLKSSGHAQLDQARVDAALRLKFSPARKGGKAVRVWVCIPFGSKLNWRCWGHSAQSPAHLTRLPY